MLEVLLMSYEAQFGEKFPLEKCAGMVEIDLINILYDCLESNTPFDGNKTPKENRFPDAPGAKK